MTSFFFHSQTYWVRPCGESSVDITFHAGGEQITKGHLGYIENVGGYSIELVVGPDLDVAARERLGL